MTEYDREKLKNFMHKSKQWDNVAEWQAKHLRECELTYSDEFLEEVRTYEATYAEQYLERFRLACNYYRHKATTPTSSGMFQRLSFRAPVTTIVRLIPTTCG